MNKFYFFAIFSLLLSSIAMAQAPQKMSFQAVIRNASNALVTNSVVGTKISILQGSSSGSVEYSETQSSTTNANGLLTLEIGAGTIVTGNFATINWSSGPYFIKTETDIAGGTNYTIVATQQMMSVPYALYAEKSGTANTSSAFSYLPVDANQVTTVLLSNLQTTPYTVPAGKKMYTISILLQANTQFNCSAGVFIWGGASEYDWGTKLLNASSIISSDRNTTKVLGYLIDETQIMQPTANYIVPVGKTLYILHMLNVVINGVSINKEINIFKGTMPLIVGQGQTVGAGFIGYIK